MKPGLRLIILAVALALTACTNANLSNPLSTASSATASPIPSAPVTISQVLRDQTNPTGTLDVMDNGAGSMGTYCGGSSTSTGGATTTPCQCVYTYNMPDPSDPSTMIPEELEVNTSYVEADMLECPYSSVPSSVTQMSVSVYVDSAGASSNSITFTLIGGGSSLDMTQTYNYSLVNRYACHDIVNILSTMDSSGIYDPVQSDNPVNAYPLDFYASNMGATLAAYAGAGGNTVTTWDCPANPLNPPSNYQVTIYSEAPLGGAGGSEVISGGTSAALGLMNTPNARSTFYLANQPSSVFTVPVDAYIAPTIISSQTAAATGSGQGIPTLGFGASPISTSNDGTERCPDTTVPIPTGYQWVKVWLFRMALPARQVLESQNLAQLGSIGCNMGPYANNPGAGFPPDNWTLPDCYQSNYVPQGSGAVVGNQTDTPSPGYSTTLATRFSAATGLCYRVKAGGYVTDGDGSPAGTISGDPVDSRTDEWIPNDEDTEGFACGAPDQSPIDNQLYSCPSTSGPNGTLGAAPSKVTYDSSPNVVNLDSASVRYEFLFVVTPTTVNTVDMSNGASAVAQQYTPYRFQVQSDCNSTTPSSACSFTYAFRNYGLKLYDVTSNGDPPASNPSATPVFPVCAIQPVGLPQ